MLNQTGEEPIRRVEVFSRAQRISHWLIAAGMLFQLLSAWLIEHAETTDEASSFAELMQPA